MNYSRRILATLLVVLPALCCHALAEDPYFIGLGMLPGGAESVAMAISADGTTVVGRSRNADGNWEAFRWTADGGMVGLGYLPNTNAYPISMATGVSDDGTIVVGTSHNGDWITDVEGFRWTVDTGMLEGLGWLPYPGLADASQAAGVSADGSVIVGMCGSPADTSVAVRWTTDGGIEDLGDFQGGFTRARAAGVSADGTIACGCGATTHGAVAFQWTEATGLKAIGVLPTYYYSDAWAVSPDGNYIVGYCDSDDYIEAFRWSAEDRMEGLGFLSWGNWTEAYDVSTNGEVIVGLGGDFMGDWEAVIWTESSGMQSVGEVFALDIGVLPDGWIPQVASGITPDGKYIVGEGINPNGELEAWLAFLGDPIACMGDLNGDGQRDLTDLATLLASYGVDAGGDLDGDGDTDLSDLSALLAVYGRSCWQ